MEVCQAMANRSLRCVKATSKFRNTYYGTLITKISDLVDDSITRMDDEGEVLTHVECGPKGFVTRW